MGKDQMEKVHARPELEAGIKRWNDSGYACAPAISGRTLEDGHELSYVLTMIGGVHDMRMSCPDEGLMTSDDRGMFTCRHGAFDAQELTGMQTWPGDGASTWKDLDGGSR